MAVNEDQIRDVLSTLIPEGDDQDIVSAGLVSGIAQRDGMIQVSIETTPDRVPEMEQVRQAAEQALKGLEGVKNATAVLTAEKPQAQAQPQPQPQQPPQQPGPQGVPGVGALIAVASGKGGVGKSTTAVNLALALSAMDKTVGILDADIYGPSIPRMMGVTEQPVQTQNNTLLPPSSYGIKCMSMGMLVDEEEPVIWRGPMVMGALQQMLTEVEWGPLDILVIDMPPGTGDAQLTLAQQTKLTGAVIVSTPQDIALLDARKGLNMFRKVNVPILGIVENMSYFVCPNCGEESHIFAHGGAQATAEKYDVPFLGAVPLEMEIRETSDEGRPIVASNPESPHAQAYKPIAEKVLAGIDAAAGAQAGPNISFE
jgi:ATP-binding protein involved in chromosome partitioning